MRVIIIFIEKTRIEVLVVMVEEMTIEMKEAFERFGSLWQSLLRSKKISLMGDYDRFKD